MNKEVTATDKKTQKHNLEIVIPTMNHYPKN